MEIFLDKLYRYDRKNEQLSIGFPLERGLTREIGGIRISDPETGRCLPVQGKVTSRHADGSVRFVFLRFLADIPANRKCRYLCEIPGSGEQEEASADTSFHPLVTEETEGGYRVSTTDEVTGASFSVSVKNGSDGLLSAVSFGDRIYEGRQLAGPMLRRAGETDAFEIRMGAWEIAEAGPLCVILKGKGTHRRKTDGAQYSFAAGITLFAGKSYAEVSYRIINDTEDPLRIGALSYRISRTDAADPAPEVPATVRQTLDSTGCGDQPTGSILGDGPLYHVKSSDEADRVAAELDPAQVRTVTASSNYKTDYYIGRGGAASRRVIDAAWLMKEANEHFAETFYGTFFADCTDGAGGVCATVYQAHQNFPKAVQADEDGITICLVPGDAESVTLQSGMSREQRFLLHFHEAGERLSDLNDRSIVYQMPYRPYVSPEVHARAGVWPEVFPRDADASVEQNLIARADGHCRAYGMLNFGDSYDANYTAQGRGGGRLVWCNNEYDYPHACAVLYARTGIRRFLDYNIASASHWMDVDVCHYHRDPLYIGGQWEHTAGHVVNGTMVCSHEWVEGLLDYYHFTGDERGLETAIGIGENVRKLLDMPMYARAGESNARETGWALRTLVALYVETREEKWLEKCGKILDDFRIWEEQYGHWLAPYTDNTIIRVGFMISVAIGSLMRYYREFPEEGIKGLILRAVDDMIENCYVESWGVFYYKELPSLNRLGNNTLLLEALTIAHDLSGEKKYLEYGLETFRKAIADTPAYSGTKRKEEDAVLVGNASSKNFAQSMIPIAGFYRALSESGMKYE
ncbi:MAG: glycoside hydrolase family 127 protein [Lachnospiraceae bacterium]|nr:glycoside hydrolase family 127 protein [Lachnospiraceae bacterium]